MRRKKEFGGDVVNGGFGSESREGCYHSKRHSGAFRDRRHKDGFLMEELWIILESGGDDQRTHRMPDEDWSVEVLLFDEIR